jgi:peptide/nickel transport system permease protein
MSRYIAGRFLQALASLFIVAVIVFALSRISGDPVALMLSPEATAGERAALREQLGLNHPLPVQLWTFLSALVHGDLGRSFRFNRPVTELLAARFPNSLMLASAAVALSAGIGIPVGVLAARRPGGLADRVMRTAAVAGQSIPTFVVGVVLVLVFSVQLRLLPSGGTGGLSHLVLPAVTLGWFSTAAIARMSRSSMLEALSAPYVTVARAKGLRERTILLQHALPNALTAIVSLSSLQFVTLASGAVITEAIFDWPGIGLLMVQGAFARDYAVVQGVVILAAVLTISVNLAIDLLYQKIDPRVSLTSRR